MQNEVIRSLPVKLTDEQLAEKAQELALAVGKEEEERAELAVWQASMKEAEKKKKGRLSYLHDEVIDLSEIVESGLESQDVTCDWVWSMARGFRFLVRRDTGALVEKKELRDDERQTSLAEPPVVLQEPTPEQLGLWLGDAPAAEQDIPA